jgi:hypothetical protein
VSGELDDPDALERAGATGALKRCRALAKQIENELRSKRAEDFFDQFSLADFFASIERAANILQQRSRQSVETPVNSSQTRKRQHDC